MSSGQHAGSKWEPCRRSRQGDETNVVRTDKPAPAWSPLTPLCCPLEFWRAVFIYYRVILRRLGLPGNPVGKPHNVVFGPWSFVRVGEITLQSETQTKHNAGYEFDFLFNHQFIR